MKSLELKRVAVIPASAKAVYNIIADYRNGHARILPKHFSPLQIEKGGFGAGTELRFSMTVMGTTRNYHQAVSEPIPGQVIVEKDLDSDVITTFTILPLDENECSVEIVTLTPFQEGLYGWLESVITKSFILSVYKQELDLLKAHVLRLR